MKKKIILSLFLSVLFSFLVIKQKQIEGQTPLVFTHATIIDTSGGPTKTDMTICLENDRIMNIKKTEKDDSLLGEQIIDATGKFIIPGLWDMHIHMKDYRLLTLFIANGVTGVRVMSGDIVYFQWREEIDKGMLLGPRLIIGSFVIDGPKPFWPGCISIDNELEGRQIVRQVKKMGFDFVKIYSFLPREAYFAIADEANKQGIPFAGHLPLSVDLAEASKAGQKSIEHLDIPMPFGILTTCSNKEEDLQKERRGLFGGITIENLCKVYLSDALRNLIKEHLQTFDDKKASALFILLAKNSVWQCPTLIVNGGYRFLYDKDDDSDPRFKYIPEYMRDYWERRKNLCASSITAEDRDIGKKLFHKHLEMAGAMQHAGVGLLAGTDVFNPFCFPGFSLHDELKLFVRAGLTPMEALQAATYNPAKFFGKLDSMGTVDIGKVADLVLLEANPLEEIGNTTKISAVVARGKYYHRSTLDRMLARIQALSQ